MSLVARRAPVVAALLVGVVGVWSGCAGSEPEPPELQAVQLEPTEQLVRLSMALRGLRPSPDDVALVQSDPSQLQAIAERYAASEAFAEVLADMHGEQLLVRADGLPKLVLPQLGPMEGVPLGTSRPSEEEWPLQLVRHVARNDLPYTEVVTADYTFADEVIATAYGLPYEPGGPTWQLTHYTDGRPGAGLLSETALWRRHVSNGFNFNRLRADFVAETLLCDPIGGRDVVIEGSLAVSDPDEVAEAVAHQPECVACHQALDPLGGFFWGFKPQISKLSIRQAYDGDCGADPDAPFDFSGDLADYCYPLTTYSPETEDDWALWGLREPNYYGQPATWLDDLGASIAADPRFATCTVRRFYSWFAQVEPEEVPYEVLAPLTESFVDSGWSTQQLAVQILRSAAFTRADDDGVGVLATRPEQFARSVEALTGYRWVGKVDSGACELCWGEVDLGRSALHGYRMVAGGIDGDTVVRPTHTTTPMKWMVLTSWAHDAATHAVERDAALPVEGRHLFGAIADLQSPTEAELREQFTQLFLTVLAEEVSPDGPEVDELLDLYELGADDAGSAERGLSAVLAALLLDPRMVLH
jgi:hypothetical protein